MTLSELIKIATEVDRAYQAALVAEYGKDACSARYDYQRNAATDELRCLAEAKHAADAAVHAAWSHRRRAA